MNHLYRIDDINRNLHAARFYPLDILVIGGTGAGKSSTLNALFQRKVAEVGRGCDPQTMHISSVNLNEKMRFWDTPGMGDNSAADRHYAEKLIDMLYRDYFMDNRQYGLIDNVLVIIDGTGRDMGTTYKMINEVILPHFQKDRVIIAVNQADMAMKGRHWDYERNRPDAILEEFLEKKACSIRNRVREATGVDVKMPVCYSAEQNYHVEELLDLIIDNMPRERRKLVA